MNTVRVSPAFRLAVARALAWAMLFGGWLELGALGRWAMPLWVEGLGPVALWLASAGAALQLGRPLLLSGLRLRAIVVVTGLITAAGLHGAAHGGGAIAVCIASLAWGVLLVAASRAVRMMRPFAQRPPSPVLPAAAGAAVAWALAGDLAGVPTPAMVSSVIIACLGLSMLLPRGAAARGCRTGLFDCALSMGSGSLWRTTAGWALGGARWTMLPMMASLTLMTDWCAAGGNQRPSQIVGLHLAAMLLPPLLLHLFRTPLRSPSWVALPMATGLVLFQGMPGAQGWMAVSICHAAAWGLAWSTQLSRAAGPCQPVLKTGWMAVLAPAGVVYVLGAALADLGPQALGFVHLGLGSLSVIGALVSMSRPPALSKENGS